MPRTMLVLYIAVLLIRIGIRQRGTARNMCFAKEVVLGIYFWSGIDRRGMKRGGRCGEYTREAGDCG